MTNVVASHIVSLDNSPSAHKWIIDTGVTDHITPFLHLLTNVLVCSTILQLPNGDTASISHT